jgi:uncharacterized protein YegL
MSKTHIGFVLDASGSMDSVREETRQGLVTYIKETRKEVPDALFTLTVFDSYVSTWLDSVRLDTVRAKKTADKYRPSGWTALYDAIGNTINKINRSVNKGDKVLIVILTDGHENYSKKYNSFTVKSLIESKKRDDWTFVFLGANIDSFSVGNIIGIDYGNIANYSYATMDSAFTGVAKGSIARSHSPNLKTDSFFGDAGETQDYTKEAIVKKIILSSLLLRRSI